MGRTRLAAWLAILAIVSCAPAPSAPAAHTGTYSVRIAFLDFDERVRLTVNDVQIVDQVMTTEHPEIGLSTIVNAELQRENVFHLTTDRNVDVTQTITVDSRTKIVTVTRQDIVASEFELALD